MTENRPFLEHEVEEYERKRYRGWDQRIVHRREAGILRKILDELDASALPVLDIPCGYGRFSELLLNKGGFLVSCDISFPMVKRAVMRSRTKGRIFGVVADAMKGLPFKQDAFVCILSMRFFHHVHERKDRDFILREFFRVSTDKTILSYYRMNVFHRVQRAFRKKIKKTSTHIKMTPLREMDSAISHAGFFRKKAFPLFRGIHGQNIVFLKKSES